MRVTETRDIAEFLQCIPMEMEIRKKGRDIMPLRDTMSLLKDQFENNPWFKFFMIFDDTEKLAGYFGIFIRPERGVKTIHLYRIWYNGKKEVFDKIEEIIRQIAKETKCKRLTIEIYNNEKALERLWGFKRYSVIMERRI